MSRPVVRLGDPASVARLSRRFEVIRADLGIPQSFPPEAAEQAERAARDAVPGPDDLRDVPFVTIDPPGSTDLDQAVHLARRPGGGWHVDYAIADVPAFVDPAGAVAAEAFRRGQTLYAPDAKTPLHPSVLSEDAASLLPDVDRPAFVWRFDLDNGGEVRRTELVRGLVRSRRRLDYRTVQHAADAGLGVRAEDELLADQAALLAEVGRARTDQERARGGAGLPIPDQDVVAHDGRFALVVRPPLPAEEWNAQISLMTGMAAARIMLDGGVGLLRTMPPPDEDRVRAFRAQSERLGVPWPADLPYGEFVRGLDASHPAQLALIHAATGLFRGSGYTPVSRLTADDPHAGNHAAVAAPYAHVTAPLRRLVDRFGLVCSYHLARGEQVPTWAADALDALPERMRASDQLAADLDRGCLDAVEAAVLDGRVGDSFEAVVVDVRREGARGMVQLFDPPVLSPSRGPLELGARLQVRLVECDPERGVVAFEPTDRPTDVEGEGR